MYLYLKRVNEFVNRTMDVAIVVEAKACLQDETRLLPAVNTLSSSAHVEVDRKPNCFIFT